MRVSERVGEKDEKDEEEERRRREGWALVLKREPTIRRVVGKITHPNGPQNLKNLKSHIQTAPRT